MSNKKTKEVLDKIMTPPNHLHLAEFGSELRCKLCNPYCWQNHLNGRIVFCGDANCPMNPKQWSRSGSKKNSKSV